MSSTWLWNPQSCFFLQNQWESWLLWSWWFHLDPKKNLLISSVTGYCLALSSDYVLIIAMCWSCVIKCDYLCFVVWTEQWIDPRKKQPCLAPEKWIYDDCEVSDWNRNYMWINSWNGVSQIRMRYFNLSLYNCTLTACTVAVNVLAPWKCLILAICRLFHVRLIHHSLRRMYWKCVNFRNLVCKIRLLKDPDHCQIVHLYNGLTSQILFICSRFFCQCLVVLEKLNTGSNNWLKVNRKHV